LDHNYVKKIIASYVVEECVRVSSLADGSVAVTHSYVCDANCFVALYGEVAYDLGMKMKGDMMMSRKSTITLMIACADTFPSPISKKKSDEYLFWKATLARAFYEILVR
jgi:hypothetical protein